VLRNVRNYQSARSHPRSLKSSCFKIMNTARVAKYTSYKTYFRK
jgi:hypothetical protein